MFPLQLYRTCLGYTEREVEAVGLLITSHAIYMLKPAAGDVKYTVQSVVQYQHLDYLSVSTGFLCFNVCFLFSSCVLAKWGCVAVGWSLSELSLRMSPSPGWHPWEWLDTREGG